jgi:subtilisin family serine protease
MPGMAGGSVYSSRAIALALVFLLAAVAAGSAARAHGATGPSVPSLPTHGEHSGGKDGKKKKAEPKQIGPSFVREQWPLRATRAKNLKLKHHRALAPVIVATIDSGVTLRHPDLKENLWRNPFAAPAPSPVSGRFVPPGSVGWDMLDNDPQPDDIVGHGTAVAGLIAAEQGNGGVDGVAPNVKLMAMKACWRPVGGDLTCGDAGSASAIDWAAARGARIIHLSWTLGGGPLVGEAIAQHPSVLFVANAGNGNGANVDGAHINCTYPAPNLICVAGSTRSGAPTPCTSIGPESVDVAAPGIGVTTTARNGRFLHNSPCAVSFAGPQVSGLAAILLGAAPRARPLAVKAAILDGALPGYGFAGKTVTGGVIDVPRSLSLLRRRSGGL